MSVRRCRTLALAALGLIACQAVPGPSVHPSGAPEVRPAGRGLVPFSAPSRTRERGTPAGTATGALLVLLRPGATSNALREEAGLAHGAVTGAIALGERRLVRLVPPPGAALGPWRRALESSALVSGVFAEGRRFSLSANPSPTPDRAREQWAHRPAFADTEGAWAIVPDDAASKVVVAVLDTGLDAGHPEFSGRVVAGGLNTTVEPPTSNTSDDEGHGTHCAGIVAAANDAAGVRGVAPGARILPMRVLAGGAGTDLSVLSGMMEAVRWRPNPDDGSRVRVISMSLGASHEDVDALYTQAVAIARRHGILVVIASGNDAAGFVVNPGNTPGALAVGSTGRYLDWERLSPFSNGGTRLALVAPGEAILSTYPRNLGDRSGYDHASGTSMATPFVAGVAALLAARYDPGNTRLDATYTDAARARLIAAVDDMGPPGRDDMHGTGRIDARRAVFPTTLEATPPP